VFLDARDALGESFAERFPTVYAACRQAGIDPARQPMPVAPAAHYHMGGIAVDEYGRSSVPGLWAVGEVAATGLHGANRLASNSLLEALVFGERAARDIAARPPGPAVAAAPAVAERRVVAEGWPSLDWLRRTMDAEVGVERDAAGLTRAICAFAPLVAGQGATAALRNAATTALLVATAALGREESRGGHFRSDHPATAPCARRHFLTLKDAIDRAAAVGAGPMARAAAG
jgi:L-aspartate oxidase